MNKTKESLRTILELTMGIDLADVNDDDQLLSNGFEMDSLTLINIVVMIEDEFDITLDILEDDFWTSINTMWGYIVEQIQTEREAGNL